MQGGTNVEAGAMAPLPAGCGEGRMDAGALAHFGSPSLAASHHAVPLPDTVQRSVASRQLEFIAGRIAAREALRRAGHADPPPVGMAPDRAPLWPAGYTGSITHAGGEAWAAAAPRSLLRAVGIDLERVVTPETLRLVGPSLRAPGEALPALPWLPAADDALRCTLLFSAKEAAYKCLAGHGGRDLGFADLQLARVDGAGGRLVVRLLAARGPLLPAGLELEGGFALGAGRVQAWLAWPAA